MTIWIYLTLLITFWQLWILYPPPYIRYHHLRPGLLHSMQTSLGIHIEFFEKWMYAIYNCVCVMLSSDLSVWSTQFLLCLTLLMPCLILRIKPETQRSDQFFAREALLLPCLALLGHCPACNHACNTYSASLGYNLMCDTRGFRLSGLFLVVGKPTCVLILEI